MYCNQCGNILTEQGAFCSFCGARNDEVTAIPMPQAAAADVQAAPTAPVAATPAPEQNAALTEPIATPEQAAPISQPISTAYTIPAPPYAEIAAPVQPQINKEEKYYTFKHIVMCLAAVAVMAVTAGIFAGLYFSVI